MKEYTAYCKKYIINLGIPYIIFSIVYVLMNIAIAKTLGGINTAFEIKDIIQIWYKPVAQYWFLYVLLGLKLLTPIMLNVFSKEILYILCVVAEFVYRTFVEDCYSLQGMLLYLIGYSSYYCLGLLCGSRKRIWMEFIEHRIVSIGCIAGVDLILNWILLEKVTSGVNVINNQLIAGCLIAIVAYISNKMKQNGWLGKLFERCGKYSLYVFALHVFPCAFCRIIMAKMGIKSALVQTLGATAVGIYTCLVVANIAEKIPIINMMFYPQKGYEKIKSGAMK